ncbi:hypothetical protein VNO77_37057 [Canavalia gladiata]|uniref:Uncharacterized protein n=1 Tax=Canavalia gladiata TaxID=3824 RepID=A0AAN9PVX7_CANGL
MIVSKGNVTMWINYIGKAKELEYDVTPPSDHRKDIMITTDVKGITWVGNMYQKFENFCLEAEDAMYQDAVKYIENQMQAVGTSVKKLYSDIMGDLLPPDEKVDTELPIDQHNDAVAGFCKKQFHVLKERPVKADIKQTTDDSRIDHAVDNDAIHTLSYHGTCDTDASLVSPLTSSINESNAISHSGWHVGRMDVKSNLDTGKNQVNKKMVATKISREISKENRDQNHGISVSKPASAEVTRCASEADCFNEIENGSTKQLVQVKSAEEKQINMSSSSYVPFGEPVGHEAMQQYDLNLEETCVMVMVNGDEFQLPPKTGVNLNTNKNKWRQAFSLSKKSARKQEYKELAAWHGNSEKVKGVCMKNLDATSPQDQKKLLLPSMSEPEWELL